MQIIRCFRKCSNYIALTNKPVSQSCAVPKSEQFWQTTGYNHATLGIQKAGHNRSFQSLLSVLTQAALWPMEQSSILSV